jgi:predicted RNase H-like HicB family nuclease
MSRYFTITIQKEADWYVAKCLENSVASQGKTMEDATKNLREALELYYEDETLPTFQQTYVTTLEVAF